MRHFKVIFLLVFCNTSFNIDAAIPKSLTVQQLEEENASIEEPKQLITSKAQVTQSQQTYTTIEWVELLPVHNLQALLNPPEYLNEIADGSAEDQISSQVQTALDDAFSNNNLDPFGQTGDGEYELALTSVEVIEAMNNKHIRLPGFVVPLVYDEEQSITEFFLVPYFGACVHLPPPPPNQILFVEYPKGLKHDNIQVPIWVSGQLSTSLVENGVATAAYSLNMNDYEQFSEEDFEDY